MIYEGDREYVYLTPLDSAHQPLFEPQQVRVRETGVMKAKSAEAVWEYTGKGRVSVAFVRSTWQHRSLDYALLPVNLERYTTFKFTMEYEMPLIAVAMDSA